MCERERKAEDNVESCGREGHERERERGLKKEDAQEREKWKKLLREAAGQPLRVSGENGHKTTVVVCCCC